LVFETLVQFHHYNCGLGFFSKRVYTHITTQHPAKMYNLEASSDPTIYVIHENDKWIEPLRDAFEKQGLKYIDWNLGQGGSLDFSKEPPHGVYYNRMSASSHTRGHRFAPEFTGYVLQWLESHGRRVVNNSEALTFEINKVKQYTTLLKFGIKTPKTIVVTGNYNDQDKKEAFLSNLYHAAELNFPNSSFISKNNRSGKGLSVRQWKELQYFKKYLEEQFKYELPVDGSLLLQQYIHSPQPYIIRCEFVNSRFLYAVKVSTSDGFELCPADHCSLIDNFKTNFEIVHEYDHHPIIKKYEQFIKANGIEVCAIEFIRDEAGEIYTYDVNTNTNYNSGAEMMEYGRMKAMWEIAAFLGRELQPKKEKIIQPENKLRNECGLLTRLGGYFWNVAAAFQEMTLRTDCIDASKAQKCV